MFLIIVPKLKPTVAEEGVAITGKRKAQARVARRGLQTPLAQGTGTGRTDGKFMEVYNFPSLRMP